MKKQIYLIPNAITAFALACGLFVIFKVNLVEAGSGTYQILYTSLLLLLAALLADFLDGAVARILKAESDFGVIFDSLADAVSFGVAPAVLFLKSLSLEAGEPLYFGAIIAAMLYSICGVLRLVRFNVKSNQAKGNHEEEAAQKRHFTGLPIPAAAIAAVSTNLFLASPQAASWLGLSPRTDAFTLCAVFIVLGLCMVSRWRFPSLKVLHVRVAPFRLLLATAIGAIFFLYALIHFFPVMLMVISWGYLLLAWTLSVIRLIAGKKSKTLEDFEPEDEDAE